MYATVRTGAVAVLGFAGAIGAAQGQTVDWSWEVRDTAGNTGFVDVGESAVLTLWAGFSPTRHGFAQAGPYDITGDAEWGAGTVDSFTNRLFFSAGAGTLGSDNAITAIQNLQLCRLFNPGYRGENPILLYSIEWTPDRYEGQFATISNGAPDAHIFINAAGTSVLHSGEPGTGQVTFQVLPAPSGVALLGPALLALHRRRR